MSRAKFFFVISTALCVALFVADMMVGSTPLSWRAVMDAMMGRGAPETVMIVRHVRLIKAVVAILAGGALSVAGLEMQTLFRNPLAGPYVLGITSGASLGVALFILGAPFLGATAAAVSSLGVAGAAWIGAAAVLAVIAAVGTRIKDIMVILILGMMFSSGVGAVVQILQYVSNEEALKSFVVWTMGSLGDVTSDRLWLFIPAVAAGLLLGVAAIKSLNLLLLGERYAVSMGLNPGRARAIVFLSTTLLAGTTTAFCGPIGFVGMAVPHVARALFRSSDHSILLPASAIVGVLMMLVCDIASKAFMVPINAVTALAGIPIVVWVVLRNKQISV